jgi:hypothetical protein
MSNTKRMAVLAFFLGLFMVGVAAMAEASPADSPGDASVEILRVESDSIPMTPVEPRIVFWAHRNSADVRRAQ